MEHLDCLIMCTFYSSCTRVIVLCTNLIRFVQNIFRYAQNTFRYVQDVRYGHVLKRLNLPRLVEGGVGWGWGSAGKIFATILV